MREAKQKCDWRMRLWPWSAGTFEVVLGILFVVWFLSLPGIFRAYYPLLAERTHFHDAAAIVEWLSGNADGAALSAAVSGGRLSRKEVRHYADVRSVLQAMEVALAWMTCAAVALMFWCRPSRRFLLAAQWRALGILGFLIALGGLVAVWDWERLFAWIHQPLFGAASWKLSDAAYSLRLFPASFWRAMAALALGLLAGTLLILALLLRGWDRGHGRGPLKRGKVKPRVLMRSLRKIDSPVAQAARIVWGERRSRRRC